MAPTERLTCGRCDEVMDASPEAEAAATAEFERRFGRTRDMRDAVVCPDCYNEILMGFVMNGFFGANGPETMH